ncbi:MAG: DEAD/DEAH box helicase, partial [Bacteroidia bacterium]
EMLNLGFRAQLTQILDSLPPKRQNILFSATLNEDVELMISKYFSTPQYVELISRGTPLEKIIQHAYFVPNFYTKINLLEWLIKHEKGFSKVLLFVKNKKIADDIYELIEPMFPTEIGVIHSNKSQPQRFSAVKYFDEGVHRLLIATDIIARGLDISNVTHVVNFDIPKEASAYIHRIGRTGRADKAGVAMSFITDAEKPLQAAIETLMNKKIPMLKLPSGVEINEELTKDEIPVTRDKNLAKQKKVTVEGGGAFHEKKAKNKKEQLGGKRSQEKIRRLKEMYNKKKRT